MSADELQLEHLTSKAIDLRTSLLPRLRDQVFHVTTAPAFGRILSMGVVLSNRNEQLPYTFPQSEVSFGRRRGYVCLFDLRRASDDAVSWALDCFYFLDPGSSQRQDPVFLFVKDTSYGSLIPIEAAQGSTGEMWIPRVEAWYPSDLPMSAVRSALVVNVQREEEPASLTAVRQVNELFAAQLKAAAHKSQPPSN